MRYFVKKAALVLVVLAVFLCAVSSTRADLVDDLKSKIAERNTTIANLEKEIAEYQAQVEKTSAQAQTLKKSIDTLELTRKKLSAEISVLQNKIAKTNLQITQLNGEIKDTELTISRTLSSMGTILDKTNQEESNSLVETLLNYPSLSVFLNRIHSLNELNEGLTAALGNFRSLKSDLQGKQQDAEDARAELQSLASDLSDKKQVAEYNKAQTNKLLTDTKNKQANYQKLLDEKIATKKAFEQELLEYESQLKFAIDPTSLPKTGSGVLKWPVANVKITQYFGNTEFAQANKQVYNGQGHNGIDLRAVVGTPLLAALGGKIVGTGNTDTVCPNASYGKWVLIEHPNGLSTLYAHLSIIKVVAGEEVTTGQVIGYSGETGYATGPHLHFTVYATQGVKIMTRKSAVCKGSYTMPVASLNAYLNPLLYL